MPDNLSETNKKEELIKELRDLINAESIIILSKDYQGGINVWFRGRNISAADAVKMYGFGIHLTYQNALKKGII